MQGGSTVTNYELRPGDRIQVQSSARKDVEGAGRTALGKATGSDPVRELEVVLKNFREARSRDEQRRLAGDLAELAKKLREQLNEPGGASRP